MTTQRRNTHRSGDLLLPLPGLLVCDLCPEQRPSESSDSDARALGWRVWRGYTLTGQWSEVVLCPACVAGGHP